MLDDGEFLTLIRALRNGSPVKVQGVLITLQHELLDKRIWQPAVLPGISHPLQGGPPLAFPWTSPDYLQWLEKGGSHLTVRSGDVLCVTRVVAKATQTPFGDDDHPHNREMVLAQLTLLRAEGDVIPAGVLAFHGVQSTVRPGAPGDENERISEALFLRLEERCGFDPRDYIGLDVDGWPPIPAKLTLSERNALLSLLNDNGEPTVGFGYWMARAEAEAGVALSASELRRRKAKRGNATKPLAKKNAQAADQRWRTATLPIARRLRAEDPTIGHGPLIDAIYDAPDVPALIPGPESVLAAIRAWEEAGELVRSTLNPRA